MAGSLREQLLKAGLVDGQKTKQVEAEKRKAQKQREYQAAQAAHRRELEQAAAAKVEKDRALNQKRQESMQRRALVAEIHQLVAAHRVPRDGAELAYQFLDGSLIKRLYVTAPMRDALMRGSLSLVRMGERYEVVPTAIAEKIHQRDARCRVAGSGEPKAGEPEDAMYSAYVVPDDLMW